MASDHRAISSGDAPTPVGGYPHARRVGNLLFLSGLGPRDPADGSVPGLRRDTTGKVIGHDIEVQCHAVFRNVKAVLKAAGADWSQLVDVTVFLTDIENDFSAFNRLWAEYFPGDGPCRTTVEVNRLPTPIAIELKCIAAL